MAEQSSGGFGLPLDYQGQLDSLTRRRQMAQALLQRSMEAPGTQMLGQVAVRQSPFSPLIQALTRQKASEADMSAAGSMREILARADEEARTEMSGLTQLPLKERIARALSSRFEGIRRLGGEWQKQYADRVREGVGVLKDAGAFQDAVRAAEQGELPANWQDSFRSQPQVMNPGGGAAPVLVTANRKGESQMTPTNPLPAPLGFADELRSNNDRVEADLKGRREDATIAVKGLPAVRHAVEALQAGAQAGGGEGYKQGLRKVLQFFNFDAKGLTETSQLEMALGQQVLQNARALAPVTQEDVKRLEVMLGSINTDPTALSRALAFLAAKNIQTLHSFKDYVQLQESGLPANEAFNPLRAKIRGELVGREVPPLFGPQDWQMGLLSELQKLGVPTDEYGRLAVGGKPVEPGADLRFSIPRLGAPRLVRPPPAPASASRTPLPPGATIRPR